MELLKRWYVIVSAIVALLFTAVTVDSDLILKNVSLVKEWYLSTPSMTGSWSSRYSGDDTELLTTNAWLEADEQTALDLVTYDGKLDGVISTPAIRNFIKSTPQLTNYFLFQGTKDFIRHSALADVYEFIDGKKVYLARVRLKMDGDNIVLTDVTEGGSPFIPKKTVLLRRSDQAYGDRFNAYSEEAARQKAEKLTLLLKELSKKHSEKNHNSLTEEHPKGERER